jgi:hypothetical protein
VPGVHDDLAAVLAGPGPMSTTWSASADRLLVVLDDDHRVAQVAQPLEGLDQPRLSRWCRPIDGSSST